MTSIEILDKKNQLVKRNADIISAAKAEVRELTAEENTEFEANQTEIRNLDEQAAELERELNITEEEKNTNKNISIDNKMENNISLQRAFSAAYAEKAENVDMTRAYTVASEGSDVVPVDIWEVMRPLLEEVVFDKIGAQIYTGLHNNAQIPVFNGGVASWVSETGDASDGSGAFTSITLSPKRFALYVPISKQFLLQSVPSAEAAIREAIARAASAIIENTMWDDAAASEVKPAGLLYGLDQKSVETYSDLVNLEADLRAKKFRNVVAICSPHAEADFKSRIKGTNATGMIMENGKIDGLETHVTSALGDEDFVLMDGSQLIVGFWGEPEIKLYDDSYYAKKGQVCIVLNGYADFKLARAGAIEYASAEVEE